MHPLIGSTTQEILVPKKLALNISTPQELTICLQENKTWKQVKKQHEDAIDQRKNVKSDLVYSTNKRYWGEGTVTDEKGLDRC